jgi:NADH dehydrogenase
MTKSMEAPQVVVVGAGYAGLIAAKVVARRSDAVVTLINDSDRFQERMRNHQRAAGRSVREVPLQQLVKRTGIRLVIDRVTRIDPEQRVVELARAAQQIHYDTLIYALGSRADLDSVPGASEHASAVATAEHARRVSDRAASASTIAVVGGGLTGIETVTELAESYPNSTVKLVTRTMPGAMLNERGRTYLLRTFERLGIELIVDAAVVEVRADGLLLGDGRRVPAEAVVWTTGFTVPSLAREAGLDVDDRGRVLVDSTLRSVSHPDVYCVGDAAAARTEDGHELRMGCGPGGIAGVAGALAVGARMSDQAAKPLRYYDQAWHISLGRHDGIIQLGMDKESRVLTGRLAALIKERVALRGAMLGLRHPALSIYSNNRF